MGKYLDLFEEISSTAFLLHVYFLIYWAIKSRTFFDYIQGVFAAVIFGNDVMILRDGLMEKQRDFL